MSCSRCPSPTTTRCGRPSRTSIVSAPSSASTTSASTAFGNEIGDRTQHGAAERQLGLGAIDVGRRHDALQDRMEMVVAAGNDADQQVTGTGDRVDLQNFGNGAQV